MRSRGFTLLELMVTVAVIAILAALAVPMWRAAVKNATVQSATFELKVKLEALRMRAMREQRDLLAVVVDARGNLPTNCVRNDCAAYYLLETAPGFRLDAFDPAVTPYPDVDRFRHTEYLGNGIKFYLPSAGRAAPPPFQGVSAFDPQLVANCGTKRCVGIRFRRNGTVQAEWPNGVAAGPKLGLAFVVGSDVDQETAGSEQKGIVVSFPAGLVTAYGVSR
jgi:prepilin-type N-terminal cleavage/methylation domain-containing protein